MNSLIYIIVIVCGLCEVFARVNLINSVTNDKFSYISNATIDIISTCYAEHSRNVILTGNIENSINHVFTRFDNLLIVSIHNSSCNDCNQNVHADNHRPVFVVITTSYSDLKEHMAILKTLPQWNINEPYFILDRSTNSCKPFNFLRLTWNYNLLFSIFVCYQDGLVQLYNFNPFVNMAPHPWQLVNDFEVDLVSPWTLFSQLYRKELGVGICKNLHWDKTQQLNGYKVKGLGMHLSSQIELNPNNKNITGLSGYDGLVLRHVFTAMNVTLSMTLLPRSVGAIDDYGNPSGQYLNLSMGEYDFHLNSLFMQQLKNCTFAPSHIQPGLKFVLQKKGPMSTIAKIAKYLGWKLMLSIVIVSLVTLLVIIYFPKQSIILAVLEVIRLLANGPLLKPTNSLAARMYLVPVLFFFVTAQAIFQGNLAALLTKTVFEPNLNNAADLINHPHYKLYTTPFFVKFFNDDLKSRLILSKDVNCTKYSLNDPYAVCITQSIRAEILASTTHLYLSRERINSHPQVFFMHVNWPLQNKFKRFISMSTESYITELSVKKVIVESKKVWDGDNSHNTKSQPSAITVKQLLFAFKGLVYGLSLAISVFIIEIMFKRIVLIAMNNIRNIILRKFH